jgi:DNA-binding GntR family transcriptional regulator
MLDTSATFAPSLPSAEARLEVAARRLRKAVLSCELAPGEFVHEAALAECFGLGRAGIRVALTDLAAAGFVTRHARQGWRIAPVDAALITAMLDGRRRLEPSLATVRLSGQRQAAARALLDMIASVADRPEPAALATVRIAERQLRDLLATEAGAIARRWLGEIWDHSDRILRLLDLAGHPVAPAALDDLLAALAAGDAGAATRAIDEEHRRLAAALAQAFLAASSGLAQPARRSARRRAVAARTIAASATIPQSKEQQ